MENIKICCIIVKRRFHNFEPENVRLGTSKAEYLGYLIGEGAI